jgi:hypothetical protein
MKTNGRQLATLDRVDLELRQEAAKLAAAADAIDPPKRKAGVRGPDRKPRKKTKR